MASSSRASSASRSPAASSSSPAASSSSPAASSSSSPGVLRHGVWYLNWGNNVVKSKAPYKASVLMPFDHKEHWISNSTRCEQKDEQGQYEQTMLFTAIIGHAPITAIKKIIELSDIDLLFGARVRVGGRLYKISTLTAALLMQKTSVFNAILDKAIEKNLQDDLLAIRNDRDNMFSFSNVFDAISARVGKAERLIGPFRKMKDRIDGDLNVSFANIRKRLSEAKKALNEARNETEEATDDDIRQAENSLVTAANSAKTATVALLTKLYKLKKLTYETIEQRERGETDNPGLSADDSEGPDVDNDGVEADDLTDRQLDFDISVIEGLEGDLKEETKGAGEDAGLRELLNDAHETIAQLRETLLEIQKAEEARAVRRRANAEQRKAEAERAVGRAKEKEKTAAAAAAKTAEDLKKARESKQGGKISARYQHFNE